MWARQSIFVLVCLTPLVVLAEGPGREQRPPTRDDRDRGRTRTPGAERGHWPGPMGGMREGEWPDIERFFKENSPHRWQLYQDMGREDQMRIRMQLYQRYQMLQWTKREGGEQLWNLKKRQVRLEDDIFRIRSQYQSKPAPAEAEKLKDELRTKVREAIELRLAERQQRLERLRAMVESETRRLEDDRKDTAALVEREVQEELTTEGDRDRRGPFPSPPAFRPGPSTRATK